MNKNLFAYSELEINMAIKSAERQIITASQWFWEGIDFGDSPIEEEEKENKHP